MAGSPVATYRPGGREPRPATNQVTRDFLVAAGIPHTFIDYGDGSGWAEGCTGYHGQLPCLKVDMKHFVSLLMETLTHPKPHRAAGWRRSGPGARLHADVALLRW